MADVVYTARMGVPGGHGVDWGDENMTRLAAASREGRAAIEALETLKRRSEIDLYTDSNYMRGGITSWIKGWKKNGWRTADKKPVKNVELWQRLEDAASRHTVRWHWVKGHVGHDDNERADELAREGMAPFLGARRKA